MSSPNRLLPGHSFPGHLFLCLAIVLGGFAQARAQIETVPLNSNFKGAIADPALPVAFAFEGIEGIKAAIVVQGVGDFRPLIRVLDSGGVDPLAIAESNANGTAAVPEFVPPASGTYILEINSGAAQPTGEFTGSLNGKVPKEMKSAKFPKDSQPGEVLQFFALAGTELSGKIRIWTKPHPATKWYTLIGPSGPIDTHFQTLYSGFNKYASLKKVHLAETGTYTIAPSQANFKLTGKVTLKPPKGGSDIVDVGDEPFLAALPEPVLNALPSATLSNSITVSGTAAGATQVELSNETNVVVANVTNGAFSVLLPLVQNSPNVIHVTALGPNSARSNPALARIVHDAEPPFFSILTPINNASLVGSTVHVSGVVGDRLSPLGVTVTVNLLSATVDPDWGDYGSFERRDVPIPSATTNLSVIARDALGNQASKTISVKKAVVTGFSTLSVISGDGQTGVVGSELAAPLVVKVATSSGAAFPSKLVEFKTIRGDVSLGSTPGFTNGVSRLLVTTDAAGLASVRVKLGSDAGPGANRVTVSSAGIVGVLDFSATATAKPAARLAAVMGNTQVGPLGATLPRALVARVTDGRNPIANVPVRFSVLTGGGTVGGFEEFVVPTNAVGLASVAWRLGRDSAEQRVIANASGIDGFITFDAAAFAPSIVAPTSLSGIVHDVAHQPLVGATAQLFVNGASLGTTQTNIDGRFLFTNVAALGAARIAIDGSTVTLVGSAGTGTGVTPTFASSSQSTSTLVLTRGAVNLLPFPILLPPLDLGTKIYNGAGDQVFSHPQVDAFKATLTSGTVVTLANGQTVPGAGGSVSIGVAMVPNDDFPRSIPDGLSPQLGFIVNPPQLRFGTPVAIEAPNTAGIPYGARAKLLQYNPASDRFEVTSELVSNGRTLVSETGSGLTRSGFAMVATEASGSMARIDCAGLALGAFADSLVAARQSVETDVSNQNEIVDEGAALVDALEQYRATTDDAVADATVTVGEWNDLRSDLGAVESRLFANVAVGGERAPIARALALDGGFDGAIAEATASSCGGSITTAANQSRLAYTSQSKTVLAELDTILAARDAAWLSTNFTVDTLRVLLAADTPPLDAVALLSGPSAQFFTLESELTATTAQLAAALANDPDVAIAAAADPLELAFTGIEGASQLAGAALRAGGQLSFADETGAVSIRGIAAGTEKHVVGAVSVTSTAVTFAESPLFTASAGVDSAPLQFALSSTPPSTVLSTTLSPTVLDVAVGGVGQFALSSGNAYGPGGDITTGASGTTWRSSDPAIVGVSADGAANGVIPGVAYVTGRHKDIVASRKVTAVGDHLVTIFGTVMLNSTTPAPGAVITTTTGPGTTTAADGSFVLPLAVPSNANTVTLIATTTSSGQTMNAVASFIIENSGPADAGVLTVAPAGNILIGKAASMVVGTGTMNNSLLSMNNGLFAVAGTAYNTIFCCWWNLATPTVEWDLAGKFVIFSAVCQGDSNDTYVVEILDSFTNTWKVMWDVPNISAAGAGVYARPHPTDISQKYAMPVPMIGTKIRLRAGSGDGNYGIAELQLYGVTTN